MIARPLCNGRLLLWTLELRCCFCFYKIVLQNVFIITSFLLNSCFSNRLVRFWTTVACILTVLRQCSLLLGGSFRCGCCSASAFVIHGRRPLVASSALLKSPSSLAVEYRHFCYAPGTWSVSQRHLEPASLAQTRLFVSLSLFLKSNADKYDDEDSNNNMESASNEKADDALRGQVIDGKQIAEDIREEIRLQVAARVAQSLPAPGLAVILVGSRRDSQTYVNMKKKACAAAGITSVGYDFDESVTPQELLDCVETLNKDVSIHGILIQLPLPSHLNQDAILRAVDPAKDVDGLHPANTAALQLYSSGTGSSTPGSDNDILHAPFSIPCTPLGCLVLLDRCGVSLKGKHCVVLGRSQLVGWPMARLLLGRDATVTVCHSKTTNPAKLVAQADVVVAAVGRPELVKRHWLKDGAVVIDVGINSVDIVPTKEGGRPYKLVGDVDYDDCASKCRWITPVPGGVGPMTIAMLLQNTLRSCERMTK